MTKNITLHEGVIRPGLIEELETFQPPRGLASTYYLNLAANRWGDVEKSRVTAKTAVAEAFDRVDSPELPHATRMDLRQDRELVDEAAAAVVGERHTLGLACFVSSQAGFAQAVRIPWPVRQGAHFEERFVVWPLRQILDQSDRFAIVLTDKDDARFFLFFLGQIEEVGSLFDDTPPKVRIPDPYEEHGAMNRHIDQFHKHLERVAEGALRLSRKEPFAHLVIGGLPEVLPQFEPHLHRYLGERVVARWEMEVRTPVAEIRERAIQEERELQARQGLEVWETIQDQLPQRGAVGPENVFTALWQRRVQTLLIEPDGARPGQRCVACGLLQVDAARCAECGGATRGVADLLDEATIDCIEQAGQVRYWTAPELTAAGSIAALRRY